MTICVVFLRAAVADYRYCHPAAAVLLSAMPLTRRQKKAKQQGAFDATEVLNTLESFSRFEPEIGSQKSAQYIYKLMRQGVKRLHFPTFHEPDLHVDLLTLCNMNQFELASMHDLDNVENDQLVDSLTGKVGCLHELKVIQDELDMKMEMPIGWRGSNARMEKDTHFHGIEKYTTEGEVGKALSFSNLPLMVHHGNVADALVEYCGQLGPPSPDGRLITKTRLLHQLPDILSLHVDRIGGMNRDKFAYPTILDLTQAAFDKCFTDTCVREKFLLVGVLQGYHSGAGQSYCVFQSDGGQHGWKETSQLPSQQCSDGVLSLNAARPAMQLYYITTKRLNRCQMTSWHQKTHVRASRDYKLLWRQAYEHVLQEGSVIVDDLTDAERALLRRELEKMWKI